MSTDYALYCDECEEAGAWGRWYAVEPFLLYPEDREIIARAAYTQVWPDDAKWYGLEESPIGFICQHKGHHMSYQDEYGYRYNYADKDDRAQQEHQREAWRQRATAV